MTTSRTSPSSETVDAPPDGAFSSWSSILTGPIWREEGDDTTETRNLFHRSTGNGHFTDVTATLRAPRTDQTSRGLAVLDATQNGRPDLVYSNLDGDSPLLLTNRMEADRNWRKVSLGGVVSNRDGIGTRVTVHRPSGLVDTLESVPSNQPIPL